MNRFSPLVIITIIVAVLLSAFTEILGALIAPQLPYLFSRLALPLFGLVIIAAIMFGIWEVYHQKTSESKVSTPGKLNGQNRQRIITKVRVYWINGVLNQSLDGTKPIALTLVERPDAVADPWEQVLQRLNGPLHQLLLESSITTNTHVKREDLSSEKEPDQYQQATISDSYISQVYDQAGGELLILGEPGSGKTTLLLELAHDLLERAQRDETHPVPVVFNLSSWAIGRQSIVDWLVEELNRRYQVPRKLGKQWVDTDQLLPLIDGLNEAPIEYRRACIDAINAYRHTHGILPMVVCSRSDDYFAQTARLLLHSAVVVQPLTTKQIQDYFSSNGKKLLAVRAALSKDPLLREISTSPLVLNVLTTVYQGKSIKDLRISSIEKSRRQVLMIYIQRLLKRRSEARYTEDQTTHWLAYLARQMTKHNEVVFYIERMQPTWLSNETSYWFYHLTAGLITAFAIGLASGFIFGFIGGPYIGLAVGLIGGLLGAILDRLFNKKKVVIEPAEILVWTRESWLWKAAKSFMVGLSFGLIAGFSFGLEDGLIGGFIGGLGFGLLEYISFESLNESKLIRPNQGIARSFSNSMRVGLAGGIVSGLISGLSYGLHFGLLEGLVYGLGGVLVGGSGYGLCYGGAAYINHYLLRLLLWRRGCMPWNYTHFLDYATDRILLRKVGSGYVFAHRLLLDYFATFNPVSKLDEITEQDSATEQESLPSKIVPFPQLSEASQTPDIALPLKDSRSREGSLHLSSPAESSAKLLLFILGAIAGFYGLWVHSVILLSSLQLILWGILPVELALVPFMPLLLSNSYITSKKLFATIATHKLFSNNALIGSQAQLSNEQSLTESAVVALDKLLAGEGLAERNRETDDQGEFEVISSGGVPPPLPPSVSIMEPPQRYLQGRMPERVQVGDHVALEVRIALLPNSYRSVLLKPFSVPPEGVEIKLVLYCPGFRPTSGNIRAVHVPSNADSDWALFEMQAQQEGVHELKVTAYIGGAYLGALSLEVTADNLVSTGPSVEYISLIAIRQQEEGEVNLEIHFDPESLVYRYQFRGANFTEDEIPSDRLRRPPEIIVENFVAQLNAQARNITGRSPEVAKLWLQGKGIELWNEFIPKELERKFWEHRNNIKRMTILSSGDAIPWEVMYPTSESGDRAGFLSEQFPIVRWTYGPAAVRSLNLSQAFFVLSDGGSPTRALEEVAALKSTIGEGQEIKELLALLDILNAAGFGLIHFACHNTFLPGTPTQTFIQMGKEHFEPTYLSGLKAHFRSRAPLIFMNACRSDGTAPNYTRLAGWADRFLDAGAGAFIGSLWEVRDRSASLFAQKFYHTLSCNPGTTIGDAMKVARTAIQDEPGDPTWLAYTLYGDPMAALVK